MLKIRLSRTWKKNMPFFKVVVTEHTKAAKHWYIEVLGFYNPISKEFKIKALDKEILYIAETKYSEEKDKISKSEKEKLELLKKRYDVENKEHARGNVNSEIDKSNKEINSINKSLKSKNEIKGSDQTENHPVVKIVRGY